MDNIEETPISNAEENANHVNFQDALENQDIPEENTDINCPSAQIHNQNDDTNHQNCNERITPPVSRGRQSISSRE